MNNNDSLNRARLEDEQDDEWYTRYDDVVRELRHYRRHFRGKTIHCPCDGRNSSFYHYFKAHFKEFGLKRLICTEYNDYGHHGKVFDTAVNNWEWRDLEYNGSFDSYDVGKLMEQADIVATNPPFSENGRFVSQVYFEFKKDILIVAPISLFGRKNLQPELAARRITAGVTGRVHEFIRPDNSIMKLGNVSWLTTLPSGVNPPPLELTAVYSPETHPKVNDFEIVEAGSIENIPKDYYGMVAVPLTFALVWNPEQFEVIGGCNMINGGPFKIGGKHLFRRLVIRRMK